MRTAQALPRVARSFAAAVLITLGVTAGSLAAAASSPHGLRLTLSKSIPPSPMFMKPGACGTSGPDDSAACNATVIKAIDDARKAEPLAPLPKTFSLTAFDRLNADQQIFAIADIERTARGLAPIAGLTAQLNHIALVGAAGQSDPSASLPLRLTGGGLAYMYGSNFAEGTADPMGADYYWMYDDGLHSPNADCTVSNQSGCWGHRKNILGDYSKVTYCPSGSAIHMVMGAADVKHGVVFSPAITEIFVNDCGALPAMDFTWPDVQKLVFGH